jgi:hypothetical protein
VLRVRVAAFIATLLPWGSLAVACAGGCSSYAAASDDDAGSSDAAFDGFASEASASTDAETDVDGGRGQEGGADAASDCPAGAVLCSSFEGSGWASGWTPLLVGAEKVLEQSTTHARSPVSSMHAGLRSMVLDGGGASGAARFERVIATTGLKRTRLSFWYWLDPNVSMPAGEHMSIGEIVCQRGDGYAGAFIFLESVGLIARGGADLSLPGPNISGFTDVIIDIDWTKTPPSAAFVVNGQPATASIPKTCVDAVKMWAIVGLASYTHTGRVDAYYDDVSLLVE